MSESIRRLTALGQSLWYDNIQRRLLVNGELKGMIDRGEIRGVTSNPTIFQNAIAKTSDYDSAITPLAWSGWDAENIFWQLAVEDIQQACDLFQSLYQQTRGGDGYVSLEVSPFLAHETEKTAQQALELWARVQRPNLMIKIPATRAGIPAIQASIAAGINVNVTLIFSLERYAEVMEAYLSGLEDRLARNLPINNIASVASFFVSRVDSKIDPRLPKGSPFAGKAAIFNAKLAYELFGRFFNSPRFRALQEKGSASPQRPLWASTGTKNPSYPDTLYVDSLIGLSTVNTVPPATLDAFRDHGNVNLTLKEGLDQAHLFFDELKMAGVSMDSVTRELEDEGVKAFADAFGSLLEAIEEKRKTAVSFLGPLAEPVSRRVAKLEGDSVPERLWNHDPTLWASDAEGQAEVKIRLGWLDSIEDARRRLDGYLSFAREIHAEGIDRVLVLGMGGSSLSAEVFSSLLAGANLEAKLSLAILDSTDPGQIARAAEDYPPHKSLYLVASKSGGTAEVTAAFKYFWELSRGDGSRFVAVTDPGTSLETLAKENKFRKIFSSDPMVGGRFSALTDFGLVPAALLNMDLGALLCSADGLRRQTLPNVPCARNPAIVLGAILAEAALAGRDKLTILADAPVSAMAGWIEQIVAESSGKHGTGILPVPLEPLDVPQVYGDDRFFIYLRQEGELDNGIAALRHAGFPVIIFPIGTPQDAGGEFFRWEMAVSTACHILGINAFDQPDVQDSKNRTSAKISNFLKTGRLQEADLVDVAAAQESINGFMLQAQPGSFIACNAYLPRNRETIDALQLLRVAIREKTKCAVTAGFGPRFQHSTGQFHKGGPNKGLFLQIVYDDMLEINIPNGGLSFGILLRAQALGDYEALRAAGRRVLRLRLSTPQDLVRLIRIF